MQVLLQHLLTGIAIHANLRYDSEHRRVTGAALRPHNPTVIPNMNIMKNGRFLTFTAIATALLAMPATAQAETFAWGQNNHGQTNVVQVPVFGLSYEGVSAGSEHSAAVRNDGVIVAWGLNGDGQCDVPGLPVGMAYGQVSAGNYHTLAVRSDGAVIAWGRNTSGQCNVPGLPAGVTYTAVSAGGFHSLGLRSDGIIETWGENSNGQCDAPSPPTGLTFVEIATGLQHSLALRSDGLVEAWGQNSNGQCTVPPTPGGVTNLQVSAGQFHSLALRSDGSVVAWGSNSEGQNNVPSLATGVAYTDIDAGSSHSVALLSDGSAIAWGRNWEGQCTVPSGLIFLKISAGGNHTIALGNSLSASATTFGNGCPSGQPLTLSSNLPLIDSTWILTASAVSQTSAVCAFWLGDYPILSGFDLSIIGAAGCSAYTNGNLFVGISAASAGNSNLSIGIPNTNSLVGMRLSGQVTAQSTATPIGFTTSNGLSAVLGY